MNNRNRKNAENAPSEKRKTSAATKISFVLPGAGQMMRGQIVKGALYLLTTAAFVLYLSAFGGRYLMHLFSGHLGTKTAGEVWNDKLGIYEKVAGDNSFLILLYSVATVVVVAAFVVLWAMNVKGNFALDKLIAAGGKPPSFSEDVKTLFDEKLYVPLLLPPFIGLLVFTVMPLVFMTLIAFTDYDANHMPPGKLFGWVGLDNFRAMFSFSGGNGGFAAVFLRVLAWTFVWAFFATFTNYFFGLLLAMAINKKGIKGKKFWRTLFVVVIAVPQFVTLLLMQKILDNNGILNVLLGKEIHWLTDKSRFALLPRLSIILVNVWIGVPYTLLMCSGILMNIPEESYEAARIDGASPAQIFFKVTMPYMLHVTAPYLITQFVGNINNFNVIWLLTGGGPADNVYYGSASAQSTDLLVTWLYRLTTDQNPRYNIASVIGVVIFVVCAVLSLIAYNRSGAVKNEEEYQ